MQYLCKLHLEQKGQLKYIRYVCILLKILSQKTIKTLLMQGTTFLYVSSINTVQT